MGDRALEGGVELLGLLDTDAEGAAQLRELRKVRVVQGGLPDRELFDLLLLRDLAELPVV